MAGTTPTSSPTLEPTRRPSIVGQTNPPVTAPSAASSQAPTALMVQPSSAAPTVQTITTFASTMLLRGINVREASYKNFTAAFRNVTAALLSLPYRAVTITAVASALPSSPSARKGERKHTDRLLPATASVAAQGTASSYTAVSYAVATVNQRTTDFAVVLAFAVKTGQLGSALAATLKLPGLKALSVSVTDTSPTWAPSSAAPIAEVTGAPTLASAPPTNSPTNFINAISSISTGLLVGVVVGGGALCCCAVLFLVTADEYDWCGVRDRLLAQNTTSASAMDALTETVPLAQARPVSPGPAMMRPKLPIGLTGSPKGKAQFKGTVSRVYVA